MRSLVFIHLLILCCQWSDAIIYTDDLCRYHFHITPTTWERARQICNQNNGHLLMIDEYNETNTVATSLIQHVLAMMPMLNTSVFWIGLHQQQNDGRLLWDDCTEYVGNQIVWESKPDNVDGCVMFKVLNTKYTKDNCSTENPFICEDLIQGSPNCYKSEPAGDKLADIGAIESEDRANSANECGKMCYEDQSCVLFQFESNFCYKHKYNHKELKDGRSGYQLKNLVIHKESIYLPLKGIECNLETTPGSSLMTSESQSLTYFIESSFPVDTHMSFATIEPVITDSMLVTAVSDATTQTSVVDNDEEMTTNPSTIQPFSTEDISTNPSTIQPFSTEDIKTNPSTIQPFSTNPSTIQPFSTVMTTYTDVTVSISGRNSQTSILELPTSSTSYSVDNMAMLRNCSCPCSRVGTYYSMTVTELEERIKQIQSDLKITNKNTSIYRRSLISAPDVRVSARGIGYVGVFVLTVVLGSLICMDVSNFVNNMRIKFKSKQTQV